MAISREKKQQIVSDVASLLDKSKLTVFAHYTGLTVKEAQELRRLAKEQATEIRVFKNRLVRVTMSQNDRFKSTDTTALTGQLLYAFNPEDEVLPAKVLANFAKNHTALKPIGAFDAEGNVLNEATLKHLADLPHKDQLRAQVVGTIAAPLSGLVNVLSGNIRSVINVLHARTKTIQ